MTPPPPRPPAPAAAAAPAATALAPEATVDASPAASPGGRRGRLLLVPNALDLGDEPVALDALLPAAVIAQAAALRHWVAEDARSARAFLKRVQAHVPLSVPLQSLDIRELPRPRKGSGEAVPAAAWDDLLAPALDGRDIGLVSDAGLPAVADPGARLVAAAHAAGVPVQPLAGASALTLALAASGLHGQSFAFVGYLPQDPTARAARVRLLETESRRQHQTQLCIETPYRNAALLQALCRTLQPSTRLAVSAGLTLAQGWSRSATVARWRAAPLPDAAALALPAVFAWLAE